MARSLTETASGSRALVVASAPRHPATSDRLLGRPEVVGRRGRVMQEEAAMTAHDLIASSTMTSTSDLSTDRG
ncbi:hypothetical protein [Microbacterium sp. No. 7]|uniref:hypothetical protein n=1 Tax=Microbacterium sp. No. 7 TaxID=1714373 RepID=UPI0006CF8507|nr:hypothetical protein [Microbacterium sp. No. 7]ALJ20520.1 hypothetical protein AOA12_11640 [Microbacterium sp. No. 7]